jgi:hypothetical protein
MTAPSSHIGIVIPYYNAKDFIVSVVRKASMYSTHIVIVNDQSKEPLPVEALKEFKGVTILDNPVNLGVGGATIRGFEYFLKVDEVKVIVKLDADDQMDTNYIPQLVSGITEGNCGFAKGNRFRDFKALKEMPKGRRFGNLFLSFLSKIATGYWGCFDFNNGYFAINKKHLVVMDLDSLSNNYFFETSLISSLYYQQVKIKEVAMPAIYGGETSNMNILKMPFLFSANLLKKFIARIWKAYFVYDFNIGTLYITFGSLLFSGGLIFGGISWYQNASQGELTPTGTIMISTLLVILGFQLLLQAVQFDIINSPKTLKDA